MKLKIQPVNHGKTAADRNRFCGPSAISALTGCTTGEASYLIRKLSRKKAVMGTHWYQIRDVLETFNIKARHTCGYASSIKKPTLAGWLKSSIADRTGDRVFLTDAGHHWQLISGRRFVCGQTEEVVSIKHDKVHRRARVKNVWELTSTNVVKPADHPMLKKRIVEKKEKAKVPTERRELLKLEKEHGFKLKVYDEGGLKYVKADPCVIWPEGFDTMHYDWSETLERVVYCIENPELVDGGYYSE